MTVQVVYIAGAGHSGSTVLDIALGQHEEMVSVGELHKLHRSGWRPARERRCSCGCEVHECPYWSSVRTAWERRVGGDRLDDYIRLQRRYESSWRCWPRLIRDRRRRSPAFESYLEMTVAVYEAISEVSGRAAVVDSSKKPSRPYALAAAGERIQLAVLHLIRDGRGVVWSQLRGRPKDVEAGIPEDHAPTPAWKTALRWAFRNLECDWTARRLGSRRVRRVLYERFTREPAAVMSELGRFLGRDLKSLGGDLATGAEMSVPHLVAGNALRMQSGVVLRPVSDWTTRLAPADRRTFWLLAGHVARRYGYVR